MSYNRSGVFLKYPFTQTENTRYGSAYTDQLLAATHPSFGNTDCSPLQSLLVTQAAGAGPHFSQACASPVLVPWENFIM